MKNILLLFFLLGLFSCGSNDGIKSISSLMPKDTITIDFGDFPLPNERSSYGSSEDKFSYSFTFNDSIGIFIIDLKSKTWKNYLMQLDGDSGLRKGGDFYFINDSLGLYNLKGSGDFQIVDFKSKTTLKYKFNDSRLNVGNASRGGIYFNKNMIGFPVSYSLSNKEIAYTKEVPIYSFFDLELKKIINSFGFPIEFHNNIYSLNHLSRTFLVADQKIYLNMAKSPKIYVFDLDCNLIKEKEISTDEVSVGNSEFFENPMKDLIYYTYGGSYSSLLYDGEYFYRTASFLENKDNFNIDDPSGFVKDLESMKIEILKFDNDLNLISKSQFFGSPVKKGLGDGNYFVTNDKPYFWLLDKVIENQERYVAIQ